MANRIAKWLVRDSLGILGEQRMQLVWWEKKKINEIVQKYENIMKKWKIENKKS